MEYLAKHPRTNKTLASFKRNETKKSNQTAESIIKHAEIELKKKIKEINETMQMQ